MKALVLVLACALPAAAAPPTTREFVELPPGRYTIALTGMLTTVCGRAIAAEWARLPEVESASVNYDRSEAVITVRLDRTLKVAVLRKTLRPAEKLANLGARYDVRSIAYKLGK
jgi:hypothetical protein